MQNKPKPSPIIIILIAIFAVPVLIFGFFLIAPMVIYGMGGIQEYFSHKADGMKADKKSKEYMAACKALKVPSAYQLKTACKRNDDQPDGRYPEIAAYYGVQGTYDTMEAALKSIAESNGYTNISSSDFEFEYPQSRTIMKAAVSNTVQAYFVLKADTTNYTAQNVDIHALKPTEFKVVYSYPVK